MAKLAFAYDPITLSDFILIDVWTLPRSKKIFLTLFFYLNNTINKCMFIFYYSALKDKSIYVVLVFLN
jgi:hypothetical protein